MEFPVWIGPLGHPRAFVAPLQTQCVDLVLQAGAVGCRAHSWMRSLATFPLNSLCSTSRKEASDRFQLDFFVSSAAGSYSLVLMGAKSNDTSISFWELFEAPRSASKPGDGGARF